MNVEMERWPTMMGWEGRGDEKKKQHGNSSTQRKIK